MTESDRIGRRRLFAPEVVQTSQMDCGPASLKCLLEGFGVAVSYGRLREACHTSVDGTSIDTLEEIAVALGLDAEQILIPVDHLLLGDSDALPAIVVVRYPDGMVHFVVAWRRHGRVVQVMDPAIGRRWRGARALLEDVYAHDMELPAEGWREWAGSDDFLRPLRARIGALAPGGVADTVIADALADSSWRSVAAADAAVRMTDALVRRGGLARGRGAGRLVDALYRRARDAGGPCAAVPDRYWTARPADDEDAVRVRGAVLLRVRGARPRPAEAEPLPRELDAALRERPARPGRAIYELFRADGLARPLLLLGAVAAAAAGVLIEAVLFRGMFGLAGRLRLPEQRVAAGAGVVVFLVALLLLELPIRRGAQRIGRRLEMRFRLAFLAKIPRLGDRYFFTRPTSDMAGRSHNIHKLRDLPVLAADLARAGFGILFTTAGIIWLDPSAALFAIGMAVAAIVVPLALQRPFIERDLRLQTHSGALSRHYLDALLGSQVVRTHGAESSLRREHESLLVRWANTALALQRTAVAVEGATSLVGYALAVGLLLTHLHRSVDPGGALLLVYWALWIPALGQEIALLARQYPVRRNAVLRLLEPLGAPEDSSEPASSADSSAAGDGRGAAIALEDVSVVAGGHTILTGVNLTIRPGEQVAIVGPSGAGKSSLVGLLLGWHQPAGGRVTVDGAALDGAALADLRRDTVWIDPAVQLWNRALLDNLRYGAPEDGVTALGRVLADADLLSLLETMPDGLRTALGESGRLVSGGEGQRVRFGRGLAHRSPRLVVLDEAFRGLDRGKRRELLARARAFWKDASLLCITHDVADTLELDRAVVVEGGRVVEQGAPAALAGGDSRYRALVDADRASRDSAWSGTQWRRLTLDDGTLTR